MNTISSYFIAAIISLVATMLIMPYFMKAAVRIGLVDKPNARKVHDFPVPLVGGVTICLISLITYAIIAPTFFVHQDIYILSLGSILFIALGVLDDRFDTRAVYKLIFQIGMAYWLFHEGVRIDNLYGILGMHELPITIQYLLTMTVIVGCINAFNLTDGIDGLATGIAIIGFLNFAVLSYMMNKFHLTLFFMVLVGSLLAFLRYNLSKKKKVFLGDAGSLFLGYVLVVSGIMLINQTKNTPDIKRTLVMVIAILILPVADSLRVYMGRIRSGKSPFRADKTHLHHLVIGLGIKHYVASLCIVGMALALILFVIYTHAFFSLTVIIIAMLLLFAGISNLLSFHQKVCTWREKLKVIEKEV
jgi:UDP-GlcNAc:undecaprenyl-phosphate/decaprenyl-phosphate GlcNAc-1-phosphate transferase